MTVFKNDVEKVFFKTTIDQTLRMGPNLQVRLGQDFVKKKEGIRRCFLILRVRLFFRVVSK